MSPRRRARNTAGPAHPPFALQTVHRLYEPGGDAVPLVEAEFPGTTKDGGGAAGNLWPVLRSPRPTVTARTMSCCCQTPHSRGPGRIECARGRRRGGCRSAAPVPPHEHSVALSSAQPRPAALDPTQRRHNVMATGSGAWLPSPRSPAVSTPRASHKPSAGGHEAAGGAGAPAGGERPGGLPDGGAQRGPRGARHRPALVARAARCSPWALLLRSSVDGQQRSVTARAAHGPNAAQRALAAGVCGARIPWGCRLGRAASRTP
jgi:hypothetical protein